MNKLIKQEQGAALLLSIILITSISLTICLGLSFLTFNSLLATRNKIKSAESYYAAEAGIEDSLLRLKNNMRFSSPNNLAVGNSSVIIEISDIIGGARTITSQGNARERIKKLSIDYVIVSNEVTFYYGAQAGEGGIVMGSNSRIEGNVFSNGSIVPAGGGTAEITETAIVALDGNKIENITVGGDTHVYSCVNSSIAGALHYVSGGNIEDCDYGELVEIGPIESQALPIPLEQIDDWKNGAAAGGTFSGDYVLESKESAFLGPIKITGNLVIGNSSVLIITGLIYVEGDISIDNNAILRLDESFGSLSGVIVNDGKIAIQNGSILQGSGENESFLMFVSTNNSLDLDAPTIEIGNNAEAAIFYAPNGLILLHNNINIREATGYKLFLDNNAVISYESGLENVNFSSGPGGSRQTKNWKEIE